MIVSRRWALRAAASMSALALGAASLVASGLEVSRADDQAPAVADRSRDREAVRHVTVFAILATPDGATDDKRLSNIRPQLERLLPGREFKLLDARTARIAAGESIDCTLTHGYTVETTLIEPIDEDGKVRLRCELFLDGERQFTATVRTPLNQLFFCERPYLTDGSRLLIGVSAREF